MSDFIDEQIKECEQCMARDPDYDSVPVEAHLNALKALKQAEEALEVAKAALHDKRITRSIVTDALATLAALGKDHDIQN